MKFLEETDTGKCQNHLICQRSYALSRERIIFALDMHECRLPSLTHIYTLLFLLPYIVELYINNGKTKMLVVVRQGMYIRRVGWWTIRQYKRVYIVGQQNNIEWKKHDVADVVCTINHAETEAETPDLQQPKLKAKEDLCVEYRVWKRNVNHRCDRA